MNKKRFKVTLEFETEAEAKNFFNLLKKAICNELKNELEAEILEKLASKWFGQTNR